MTSKKAAFLIAGFLIACLGIRAQSTFPKNGPLDSRPNYVAITHLNIWVDPNTLLKDATLVIKDGKIEDVGYLVPLTKEMRIIHGKHKYVYASFIEMFSNYGESNFQGTKNRGDQFSNNHKGAYAWNDAIKANENASDYFNYDEKKSKQLLACGFGASLSAIQDGIFRGSSVLVYTHYDHEQKLIIKHKAATQMSFNKGSSMQDYPSSAMGSVALIRQTYLDANWYSKQKGEVSLSFENFNSQRNLPIIFEAENKLAVLRAAKIGKEFGLQYLIKTSGDDYQRLEEIAATGMPLILPLNFPKPYEVEDPFDAMNVSLGDLKHWEMAPANAGMVAARKIPFALTSSNCNDATEFFNNLRKAVSFGLSEKQALHALTVQPAEFLHVEEQLGSLKKGKIANFFICNEPIFNKGAYIEEHWVNGVRTQLKQSPSFAIAGNYQVKLKGYDQNILSISKDNKEVQLKGTDTLKVNFHEAAEIFTISFKENKKSEQLVRISAWIKQIDSLNGQAIKLEGTANLANGEKVLFEANLLSVQTEIKNAELEKKQIIGKIVYPFTEYGNEILPKAENIVFKNATVWTNEKEGIQSQTDVAISNGKIVAIGKGLTLSNAKIIDATGKHLSNGIIDEHSHIGIYRGVNECTQNNTAEVRIGDVINSEDINIYRQLSGGVIACQQLHGSCNPIGGQSSIIKLRWGMAPEQLKIDGADGFIKFALGENVKQSGWSYDSGRYPQTRMGVEQVYYDAFIRAKEYEASLKINPLTTRRDLELETLVDILNKKRFISCHSYVQSEINMLMHVADSMGFKVNTFTHILEGYKVADKMKAHGVSASTFADWWAYKYEVIDAIPQNAAILNKMGVVTAINSDDAEMGRRLNQEAAKIIKYGGISEEDAWKMVTLNPAKMLHLDSRMGSIKVGKDADLVLWSANPLSIQAKAEMTFVDGVCYFNREQDLAARKANQLERERIITKMIVAKQKGEKTELKVSAPDPDYHCED